MVKVFLPSACGWHRSLGESCIHWDVEMGYWADIHRTWALVLVVRVSWACHSMSDSIGGLACLLKVEVMLQISLFTASWGSSSYLLIWCVGFISTDHWCASLSNWRSWVAYYCCSKLCPYLSIKSCGIVKHLSIKDDDSQIYHKNIGENAEWCLVVFLLINSILL